MLPFKLGVVLESAAFFRSIFKRGASMQARVKWLDNRKFVGESGSGHTVVMDGPETAGGQNLGIRPMEMMLLGMGGCASFDVVSMLEKSRQHVVNCEAVLEAERADAVPAVFTKIHIRFIVSGFALKEKQVQRAVELSAEKYCSASIMLQTAGVEVSHSFELCELSSASIK